MTRGNVTAIGAGMGVFCTILAATLSNIAAQTGEAGWYLAAGVCVAFSGGIGAWLAQLGVRPSASVDHLREQ